MQLQLAPRDMRLRPWRGSSSCLRLCFYEVSSGLEIEASFAERQRTDTVKGIKGGWGCLEGAGTLLRRYADLRRMEEFGLWPRFVALGFNGTKKSLELGNHFAPLLFRKRLNEGCGVV